MRGAVFARKLDEIRPTHQTLVVDPLQVTGGILDAHDPLHLGQLGHGRVRDVDNRAARNVVHNDR